MFARTLQLSTIPSFTSTWRECKVEISVIWCTVEVELIRSTQRATGPRQCDLLVRLYNVAHELVNNGFTLPLHAVLASSAGQSLSWRPSLCTTKRRGLSYVGALGGPGLNVTIALQYKLKASFAYQVNMFTFKSNTNLLWPLTETKYLSRLFWTGESIEWICTQTVTNYLIMCSTMLQVVY